MTATVATDARPAATAAPAPDRGGPDPVPDGGQSAEQRTDRQTDRQGGRLLIGTQSFSHDPWVGLVYPPGLRKSDRIGHYAQAFPVVELDNTYYAIPSRGLLAGWAAQTPPGFVFTAKVPLEVTQTAKLAGAAALRQLALFLDTMRVLGDRLGPLVFQMSPGFTFPRDYPALERALRALPDIGGGGLRLAMEFRHPSWLASLEPEALLRAHGVAWVWNDWLPTEAYQRAMPRAIDDPAARKVTADDFAYVRLVGNHNAPIDRRTVVIDRGRDLVRWADLVLAFRREREGRGVYVLLNNHYSGCSPETVRALQRILGLPVVTFSEERAAAAARRAARPRSSDCAPAAAEGPHRDDEEPAVPAMPTRPRYNIAPTETVTVVTATATGERRFVEARWGLIPGWAKDGKIAARLINARAETLGQRPAFRRLLAGRRCLVPADGYYEWTTTPDGRRQPIRAALATGDLFAFAGLWDWWMDPDGQAVRTCTIVTCAPNALMARFHHRMPVILQGPEAEAHWLNPEVTELAGLRSVLVPHPAEGMIAYPVSTAVNNARNDGRQLILPLE